MLDRDTWFLLVQHVFEGTTDVTTFDDKLRRRFLASETVRGVTP